MSKIIILFLTASVILSTLVQMMPVQETVVDHPISDLPQILLNNASQQLSADEQLKSGALCSISCGVFRGGKCVSAPGHNSIPCGDNWVCVCD